MLDRRNEFSALVRVEVCRRLLMGSPGRPGGGGRVDGSKYQSLSERRHPFNKVSSLEKRGMTLVA